MGQFEFDQAIALTSTADPSVASGVIDDAWRVGNGVNGGMLVGNWPQAALRRVLDQDGRHPDPLALSAYFLSPLAEGEVNISTEVLRAGREMSTGQFALRQTDQTGPVVDRVRGLATFSAPGRAHPPGVAHRGAAADAPGRGVPGQSQTVRLPDRL